MALRMPRPFAHKTGVFFLNVRVPQDLLGKLRRTRVTLPVGDMLVTISVSDKVFLSLQTKDPNLGRIRFAAAYSALVRHWEAVRAGPKPLTHKQLVALAGEAYRNRVDAIENDPEHGPHVLAHRRHIEAESVGAWRFGDDGDTIGVAEAEAWGGIVERSSEIDEKMAHFFTALQRPFGPQLIALEIGRDLDTPFAKVTYAGALEDLFGEDADRLIATHALVVDDTTRGRLLREIGIAMNLVGTKVLANAEGDHSVDDSKRFPAFAEPNIVPLSPAPTPGRKSVSELVTKWTTYSAGKKASSTIRRYGPSLRSFARFQKDVDVRLLTSDDVRCWAEYRRDHDGIAPRTVNRNDLVAVMTLFAFATTHEGGKLRVDNPARGIKLDKPPKKMESVDKIFSDDEASAILRLARSARPLRAYPRASASRRWIPFLCAYTGARVQECCWLKKEDVRQRDGFWVVHFPQTKEGVRRWVTVHDALLDEGFLEFWRKAPDGPLFTGDKPQKANANRTPAEQRASELTAWIRENVALDPGISPSHGWRHTFISNAEDVGISKRMANAITGHNRKKDASDGYYTPKTSVMKKALDTYPGYSV